MSHIKRDQNNVVVSFVESSENSSELIPLTVDPITNRLLIDVIFSDSTSSTHPPIKIDENSQWTSFIFDDTTTVPLLCDSDGNLLVDLIIDSIDTPVLLLQDGTALLLQDGGALLLHNI